MKKEKGFLRAPVTQERRIREGHVSQYHHFRIYPFPQVAQFTFTIAVAVCQEYASKRRVTVEQTLKKKEHKGNVCVHQPVIRPVCPLWPGELYHPDSPVCSDSRAS